MTKKWGLTLDKGGSTVPLGSGWIATDPGSLARARRQLIYYWHSAHVTWWTRDGRPYSIGLMCQHKILWLLCHTSNELIELRCADVTFIRRGHSQDPVTASRIARWSTKLHRAIREADSRSLGHGELISEHTLYFRHHWFLVFFRVLSVFW